MHMDYHVFLIVVEHDADKMSLYIISHVVYMMSRELYLCLRAHNYSSIIASSSGDGTRITEYTGLSPTNPDKKVGTTALDLFFSAS